MSAWTDSTPGALKIALALCKGEYQRNVVLGWEALSGSTLKGKAAKYGARYASSRAALLSRLRAEARLHVAERRERAGKRVLVLRTAEERAEEESLRVACVCVAWTPALEEVS